MNRKTEELEEIIGYHFKNKHYLTQALTHSSYANEKKLGKLGSNERLEFLGDAVLELISSDYLYARFTQIPEGELTKKRASLVCEPSLAYCAREFGIPQFPIFQSREISITQVLSARQLGSVSNPFSEHVVPCAVVVSCVSVFPLVLFVPTRSDMRQIQSIVLK